MRQPGPAAPVLDTGEELNPYRWIILVGLITAAVLQVLDATIVNVALPQIAGNLGATSEEIGWVATGYILSNVIVLPMTAWLASRFGRKRYLVGSILLFIGASFFCGTARTLSSLVLWRIIQGAGGAALLSTCQATLREIFPREQQGTVQSLYVLGVIVAPTVGPTLGGWITDNYSWPWIFFVNLPIGLVAAALVAAFLSDSRHKVQTEKVDLAGIGLLAIGLGSLQYALEEGNRRDWFQHPLITTLAIVAVLALSALVAWELSPRNTHPVVSFRVLRNRDLSTAVVLSLALGFGLFGGVFLFPLFAQSVLGFTPTVTGKVLMPGGIATGVAAIVGGRLLNGNRQMVAPRYLVLAGMALFIWSMWALSHLTTVSSDANVQVALVLRGLGLGLLFTPINLAALNSLKGVEIAQGSAMLNLSRQLGGSFGIALLSTYVARMRAFHYEMLRTYAFPGNPAFEERMRMMTGAFVSKGYDLVTAHQMALRALAGTIHKQAATMSFNNGFLLIMLSVAVVSPLALLMRSRRPAGDAMPTGRL